jgi:hypothetical protein
MMREQPSAGSPRLLGERETLRIMLEMYCRAEHGTRGEPCPVCANLLEYAWGRLQKCPFAESKPACSRCTRHCWQSAPRAAIRAAMRYAGPRMLFRHPLLALRHLLHGMKKGPGAARASTPSP